MIELIPAIDLIDGRCVRLLKGDYNRQTQYSERPADVARKFQEMGFKRLHVVDLDGARSRHIVNAATLKAITEATDLVVDFGGGIKTEADLQTAFDCGAAMVTLGSIAVTQPELVGEWIAKYGAQRIIIGADVRNGKIAVNGWQDETQENLSEFLRKYVGKGIRNVLCTDISKDGTLQGPSVELYRSILSEFPGLHLIASGGVSGNDDIARLEAAGIPAVVFGKAFYEGKIDIEALKARYGK